MARSRATKYETFRKQRKRGSYRCRHRSSPIAWFEWCFMPWKNRKKHERTKMYDTVEECLKAERKR